MKTVKKDIERNYTGTNFVVITLAILVGLALIAWGIIQSREMVHADETATPGVMATSPAETHTQTKESEPQP